MFIFVENNGIMYSYIEKSNKKCIFEKEGDKLL